MATRTPPKFSLEDVVATDDREVAERLNLQCGICYCLFHEPVILKQCSHVFCLDHVRQMTKCPLCNRPFEESEIYTESDVSDYLCRQLGEVKVVCPYRDPTGAVGPPSTEPTKRGSSPAGGVSSKRRRRPAKQHVDDDKILSSSEDAVAPEDEDHRPPSSSLQQQALQQQVQATAGAGASSAARGGSRLPKSIPAGCVWSGAYSDLLTKHLDLCPNAPVTCPLNCGEPNLLRKTLDAHEAVCAKRFAPCTVCGELVRCGEELTHARSSAAARRHAVILERKLQEGLERELELRTECAVARSERQTLEVAFARERQADRAEVETLKKSIKNLEGTVGALRGDLDSRATASATVRWKVSAQQIIRDGSWGRSSASSANDRGFFPPRTLADLTTGDFFLREPTVGGEHGPFSLRLARLQNEYSELRRDDSANAKMGIFLRHHGRAEFGAVFSSTCEKERGGTTYPVGGAGVYPPPEDPHFAPTRRDTQYEFAGRNRSLILWEIPQHQLGSGVFTVSVGLVSTTQIL